jgi:hypothetical protein
MRVVLPLIALQAVSIAVMASLDSLSSVGEGIFAIFLAIDLISFAVVAHIYRVGRMGATPSRYFLLACLLAIIVLLFASLALY